MEENNVKLASLVCVRDHIIYMYHTECIEHVELNSIRTIC